MAAGHNCFICGVSTDSKYCPICYNCAQAYKWAVMEAISDIKKEGKRADVNAIIEKLENEKYAEIVINYLSKDRLLANVGLQIPNEKIKKAATYLFRSKDIHGRILPPRTQAILNELAYKEILEVRDGELSEVPEEEQEERRRESKNEYRTQGLINQVSNMRPTQSNQENQNTEYNGNRMFTRR